MKSDALYLGHIADACTQISTYVAGMDKRAFHRDRKTQDAVVRQLQLIGEATRHISQTFQSAHPDIAWRAITGMRNRIVHEYIAIDLDVVWEVVNDDIPELAAFVARWA